MGELPIILETVAVRYLCRVERLFWQVRKSVGGSAAAAEAEEEDEEGSPSCYNPLSSKMARRQNIWRNPLSGGWPQTGGTFTRPTVTALRFVNNNTAT